MTNPYSQISTRRTPQSEAADPRQVKNNAGGFAFTLSPLATLRRFLILGTAGGTYYVAERKLTKDAFDNLRVAFDQSPQEALDLIYEVSHNGLAHRQEPTLLAYAYACSHPETKARALDMLPKICRTGTMLFQWWGYVNNFRGMGRSLKTGVRRWYTNRDLDSLANQLVKYQSRDKVSHRKLLGLVRPRPASDAHRAVYAFAVGKDTGEHTGTVLDGYHAAHAWGGDVSKIVSVIEEYRLTHEMLPSEALALPEVWRALIPHMGLTALIRNLGRMSANGTFKDRDVYSFVLGRLSEEQEYRRARVHPVAVLLAGSTYAAGHGFRGKGQWDVHPHIVDALDGGFKMAFQNVEPTGKRRLIALDVSGSMSGAVVANSNLSARAGSSAMAMVTLAVEGPNTAVCGFTGGFVDLGGIVTPKRALRDVMEATERLGFDRTDCAVPMVWALQNKIDFDSFEIYTDNETWAGRIHPHEALRQYREQVGHDAKLIVVGMTSTRFTIANPTDPGMLDVVGFDASAPSAMADFVAGRV